MNSTTTAQEQLIVLDDQLARLTAACRKWPEAEHLTHNLANAQLIRDEFAARNNLPPSKPLPEHGLGSLTISQLELLLKAKQGGFIDLQVMNRTTFVADLQTLRLLKLVSYTGTAQRPQLTPLGHMQVEESLRILSLGV